MDSNEEDDNPFSKKVVMHELVIPLALIWGFIELAQWFDKWLLGI
jgi:hypothetical protein